MLSFFPRDVLDEILNLIESVSEGFPTYSRSRWASGMFGCFSLSIPFFLLSTSLGGGLVKTEILFQRAVKFKTINQR